MSKGTKNTWALISGAAVMSWSCHLALFVSFRYIFFLKLLVSFHLCLPSPSPVSSCPISSCLCFSRQSVSWSWYILWHTLPQVPDWNHILTTRFNCWSCWIKSWKIDQIMVEKRWEVVWVPFKGSCSEAGPTGAVGPADVGELGRVVAAGQAAGELKEAVELPHTVPRAPAHLVHHAGVKARHRLHSTGNWEQGNGTIRNSHWL